MGNLREHIANIQEDKAPQKRQFSVAPFFTLFHPKGVFGENYLSPFYHPFCHPFPVPL